MRRVWHGTGPPPARRPARRPAPLLGPLTVVIEASGLPGLTWPPGAGEHRSVHIALCIKGRERAALAVPGKPWLATEPVPGNARSARWQAAVSVRRDDDGLDFSGPCVRGDRADRHLFLAWGDVPGDGTLRLIRGSKLKLTGTDPRLIEDAMHPGHQLIARIRLTGSPGEPALTWSAEPAGAGPG
jgi:hypothetical protein